MKQLFKKVVLCCRTTPYNWASYSKMALSVVQRLLEWICSWWVCDAGQHMRQNSRLESWEASPEKEENANFSKVFRAIENLRDCSSFKAPFVSFYGFLVFKLSSTMDTGIWSCGFLPCAIEKSLPDISDLLHLEKCDKQLNVLLGTRSNRTNVLKI